MLNLVPCQPCRMRRRVRLPALLCTYVNAKGRRIVSICCHAWQAGLLGIRPQLFRHARERFEADDFYRSALMASCICVAPLSTWCCV